jgi:quercetin dioxygenase-like cupin family protein
VGGIAHGPDGGEHVQREARHHRILCEIDELEVVELRFGPAFEGVEPHTHLSHADCFFVLEGEAEFRLDGETHRFGRAASSRRRSAPCTGSATPATASCGC